METLFSEIWNMEWTSDAALDFDCMESGLCSMSSPGSPTTSDDSWLTPEPHSYGPSPIVPSMNQGFAPKLTTCPPPTVSPTMLQQTEYIDPSIKNAKTTKPVVPSVNPLTTSISDMSSLSQSIDVGTYNKQKSQNNKNKQKTKSKQDKMMDYEDSDSYSSFGSGADSPNSKKRSRLPPGSVAIFRHWLFNHLESPYPSEEEKEELAHKAGLRITQVNNWFTNARRRILPREDGDSQGRSRSA